MVARRTSVNFLSTVTNQGTVRFIVLEGSLTAPIPLRFLRRLIRDTNRRVFVILDHLKVHKAARTRAPLRRTSARHRRGLTSPVCWPE